jgi:hypothetical protein
MPRDQQFSPSILIGSPAGIPTFARKSLPRINNSFYRLPEAVTFASSAFQSTEGSKFADYNARHAGS